MLSIKIKELFNTCCPFLFSVLLLFSCDNGHGDYPPELLALEAACDTFPERALDELEALSLQMESASERVRIEVRTGEEQSPR